MIHLYCNSFTEVWSHGSHKPQASGYPKRLHVEKWRQAGEDGWRGGVCVCVCVCGWVGGGGGEVCKSGAAWSGAQQISFLHFKDPVSTFQSSLAFL